MQKQITQTANPPKLLAPMGKSQKIKSKTRDNVLVGIFYAIVILFSIACLYPFLVVFMSSITEDFAVVRDGYKLFPSAFSFAAYKTIFSSSAIGSSYLVTIQITIYGTVLQLLVTAMAAYALSGRRLKYRNVINFYFYFTMLFGGGIVATYILLKQYLHLDDTIFVYFIPTAFNAYNCFLLRNFFNEIPPALVESAKLDGASEIKTMFKIVLPLSLPALATIGLFTAVAYWNEWATGLLYISKDELFTLQYRIVRLIQEVDEINKFAQNGVAAGDLPRTTIRLATAMISVGPIILLYPFLQKYFVAGLKVGGVKG